MKNRTLGKQGDTISEIGLGCWQFGGDFGQLNESTAMQIMQIAVDNGITFFDTADVYGSGVSEQLIGKFLKQCDTPITVATKFGRGADVFPQNYSKRALYEHTHASLQRLGMERLDLLQLHCIPTDVLRDGEVFSWLEDLKADGIIRHYGASVESVEEGLLCLQHPGLQSLQVIYNLFRQKLTNELLPQAHQAGVGIIVRLPLASGLLSGKFTTDTTFSEQDHRHYNRDGQAFNVGETFAGIPFKQGVALADNLRELQPESLSLAEMSLRWILDHEAVSVIIPGASRPEQALQNAKISSLEALPESLHSELWNWYNEQVKQHIRGPY